MPPNPAISLRDSFRESAAQHPANPMIATHLQALESLTATTVHTPLDSPQPFAPRVLRLTLKKKWFDMIASGEKREEYRNPSRWIFSRLINKAYDVVEFSHGYGAKVPKVTVEFLGWHQGPGQWKWGGAWNSKYVVIRLGEIIALSGLGGSRNTERCGAQGAVDSATDMTMPP